MSQVLVEHEDIVFDAIKEYLDRNRVFEINKIIPYINSRFAKGSVNVSNEGIRMILLSLVKKKMIAEGTKLTKEDVLIYSRRKIIYDYIKEYPGAYVNKIAKKLNISNVVVYWHLSVLEKFNFIKKADIDNHIVYFDSNVDHEDLNKMYLISKEKSKKIINFLRINDYGISKTQLSNDLEIHHNTINKYLKSLENFNIVSKQKLSNKTLYFLEEK